MTTSRPAAVAVLALVVLAGCSGLVPGGAGDNGTADSGSNATVSGTDEPATGTVAKRTTGSPTTKSTGPATTAERSTPTSTPRATGSTTRRETAGNGTFPTGYNDSGVADPRAAARGSLAALGDHDNYTVSVAIPAPRPGALFTVESRVDLVDRRQYEVATGRLAGRPVVRQEQYGNASTLYTASIPPTANATPEYSASTRPFRPSAARSATGIAAGWLSNASFGDARTTSPNGETLYRYSATDVRNPAAFVPGFTPANTTLNDFNATLTVDREGVIRQFGYTANTTRQGGNRTTVGAIRIGNIDATTVDEPDWLATAKNRTNLSTPGRSQPGPPNATFSGNRTTTAAS